MKIESDPIELQREALARRQAGQRIGLVPTMGYLHQGHISLMELAASRCDWLIASIYVNPLQFGPNEDLEQYPRDLNGDADKCKTAGVDLLFTPKMLYPTNHSTSVDVSNLTQRLCGANRPGHFAGVTTVVSRLLLLSQAHVAVFGEKDYQQLAVIRRMVDDLAIPVDILGAPLVRDHDQLALSSRNQYLDDKQRRQALSLHRALFAIRDESFSKGCGVPTKPLLQIGHALLDVDRLDYLEIVDPHTLTPIDRIDTSARVLVAGYVGTTRLIDNISIELVP